MCMLRLIANGLALRRPNGDPLRLNNQDFVAIDRDRDVKYEATYRPQALYNRANEGFHANNETFLLHEVANQSADLPRRDTGPHRFPSSPSTGRLPARAGHLGHVHLRLRRARLQCRSRCCDAAKARSCIASCFTHTWSGLSTEENLKTPQTVVPDPISMGYSGKFLEAFVTRSDDLSEPDNCRSGPDQRSRNRHASPGPIRCMIARPMPASGFRIRWRWMRSSSAAG